MKKIDFNKNWLFNKKDKEATVINLPHDAMILEDRNKDNSSGSAGAYFPGGVYEYQKKFELNKKDIDKTIIFEFEGVYRNAQVYINDQLVGGKPYGYIPFFIEADEFLKYNQINTISVRVDNSNQPDSRWYTGAGIYRPVWMWIGSKEHLRPESVRITTLSWSPAKIKVDIETAWNDKNILIEIYDKDELIASEKGTSKSFIIENAKLWDEFNPYLYTCVVKLLKKDQVIDQSVNTFGIRFIEWSTNGLFINGKRTLLRGACVHHDHGILGAATHKESEFRRIKILKEAGFNAIRSAHNPTSRALLEACDYYGLYVMDETWDMWYSKKSKYDYANDFEKNYKYDLLAMINRDYNHPSVIMYSIANEVSEPSTQKGVDLAKEMVKFIKKEDPYRVVTAGLNLMIINMSAKGKSIYKEDGGRDETQDAKMSSMNSTMFNLMAQAIGTGMNKSANSKKADQITKPVCELLDIVGYNYASGRYPLEGKANPDRVIVGSETFPQDISKNWAMVKKYPYLIGDFMWTAWDYIGEAGIGAWSYYEDGKSFSKPYPWLLADVGAIDILGNPNGEAFWAKAVWDLDNNPLIAVRPANHPNEKIYKSVWRGTNALPTWTFKDCEGNPALVEIYSNATYVELFLNDKLLGKKKVKNNRVLFKCKYSPGALKAVSYKKNMSISGESVLKTVASPQLHILPEKIAAKSNEIVYVPVVIGDRLGNFEANDDRVLKVEVENGKLLAFGSANPRTEESYNTGSFTTYYGRALAIIEMGDKDTLITVSDGITKISKTIKLED